MKPDTSIRICGDFKQKVNRAARLDTYSIPKVKDILEKLSQEKYFSKLDLSQAYNQVPLSAESQKQTMINTQRGLFQFTRLPFEISSAPSIFQRVLESVLRVIPGIDNYLDDTVVIVATEAEHAERLEQVLQRLETQDLGYEKTGDV